MIVPATLGRMCRTMMRRCPQPMARADSMYTFSATLMVVPRMTREALAAPITPSARTMFRRPGPSTAMMERMTTRKGKDCQASTTRWTHMSYFPPK